MKPICCGDRADAELLLDASSEGLTIDEVNPIWLRTPAAPMPAAEAEHVAIDVEQLLDRLVQLRERFDFVVVEGVGGWLVPIRADYLMSDLAVDMNLPVVVVALNRLGCLNHTLLTVRSVVASGLTCGGVVLNSPVSADTDFALATNRDVLQRVLAAPTLPNLTDDTRKIPPAWSHIVRL